MFDYREELLCFIWQHQLYHKGDLKTVRGELVDILKPGLRNTNAGPDFLQGGIRVNGLEWWGAIEIHQRSSTWKQHKHQNDPKYNAVVLHVVFKYDEPATCQDGSSPVTIELADRISFHLLKDYEVLMQKEHTLPCASYLNRVSAIHRFSWLDRMFVARMEQKYTDLLALLKESNGDWQQVLYLQTARSFGFHINRPGFEQLARSLPYKLLINYRQEPKKIDALIFGQSGLLGSAASSDPYQMELHRLYKQMQNTYGLKSIDACVWNTFRTRPSNFPAVRLAQFAAFCKEPGGFAAQADIFEPSFESVGTIMKALRSENINEYWLNHYQFGQPIKHRRDPAMSLRSAKMLFFNIHVVILYSYGRFVKKDQYICQAVRLVEDIPRERNRISAMYQDLGFEVPNMATSQGLMHMKQYYCDQKKCLSCGIGLQILSRNRTV